MFGLELGLSFDLLYAPAIITSYDPAAQDFFDWSPTVPDSKKDIYNQAFLQLRGMNVLVGQANEGDTFYIMCGFDRTGSKKNLLRDAYHCTEFNAPNWLAQQGFKGDAASAYLNTNFNPSTAGGKYSANSAHMSVYNRSSRSAVAYCAIGANGTVSNRSAFVFPWYTTAGSLYDLNDGSVGNPDNTASAGCFVIDRSSATARSLSRNGTLLDSSVTSVGGVPDVPITLLARNTTTSPAFYSGDQIALASAGGHLSDIPGFCSGLTNIATLFGANV